jgi:hypothetical protein
MTRTEVDQIITDTLHKTLGRHAHLFNLQESTAAKEAREAREKEQEKRLKEARRQEKATLKETARSFQELCGFDKKQARQAAKAQARRYRG